MALRSQFRSTLVKWTCLKNDRFFIPEARLALNEPEGANLGKGVLIPTSPSDRVWSVLDGLPVLVSDDSDTTLDVLSVS